MYPLTSTYGIPAWRWEVPPNNFGRIPLPPRLASAPLPSKAPTSLLPLNSRGAVWGGFGPLATYIFFGVTTVLGNISLHCNYMCIFKNTKVLTLSSTQLGSQGNLEKIPFGEVLGWRIWSGGAQAVQESTQLAERTFTDV